MNRTRPVSRPVLFQACGTLRGKNAQEPGPPTVTSSPILKVISPASTQATSSLSRCRWNRLLVPTGTVSSNSMMLSLVSWPTSFRAAKRPGAPMSRCFPPPSGTTKPLDEAVEPPRVLADHLAACVRRQVAELLGDVLLRVRPDPVRMREVRAPHDPVRAELVD